MTEKRPTPITKPVLEKSRQQDSLQSQSSYKSLRSRIKTRLLAELKKSGILITNILPSIWDIFFEKALGEANVVLSRPDRKRLSDELFADLMQEASSIVVIFAKKERLTPRVLRAEISPYLIAIEDIQHIIDEIEGRKWQEVRIQVIAQHSPISVSLDGVASAANLIRDSVIPWRREHDEIMARLIEQEKLVEIENKKAEILDKRAQSARGREEAKKLQLENERLRLQLQKEKLELAISLLQQLAPNLSETEKTAYLIRIISPLETILINQSEVSFADKVG